MHFFVLYIHGRSRRVFTLLNVILRLKIFCVYLLLLQATETKSCSIVFRIVGHSLKSGINEIINMFGYNVSSEPVMVH